MIVKQFLALALCVALPALVSAAKPEVESHCASEEKVIFSCSLSDTKIVSLCASPSLTPTDGYLQYRFGPVNKPELVYPTRKEHPKKYFQSGTQSYSGGGSAFLKFKKGDYTYIVLTGIGRGWGEKEGVVVEKSGKRIAYLPCRGPWTSEIGPVLFKNAQIPRDPKEIEFEIP